MLMIVFCLTHALISGSENRVSETLLNANSQVMIFVASVMFNIFYNYGTEPTTLV